MLGLDPRSITLLAGMLSAIMSFVLFFLSRNYPPSIKGLREWTAGPMLCFASTVLFALRGWLPDALSIIVGNGALLLGCALFYFGSQRFFGREPAWRLWGSLIAASELVFTWLTLVQPDYNLRVIVFSALMLAIFASHAVLLVRHGHGFPVRFTTAVVLLLCGSLTLRLVTTLLHPHGGGMFDATLVQTAYVATYTLCILLVTIGVILMATDRMRAEFEHLATHDPLTGVLTRRALIEACNQELDRSRRYGQAMSLLMMDLDHFKAINDCHGHQAGDRVLCAFVAGVGRLLRRADRIGRYGGEEFVVMLPQTARDEASAVAARIREATAALGGLPRCTVSIGVATLDEGDGDVDALLGRADAALYQAKARGRDQVVAP